MLNPINKILKFTALPATFIGLLAACGGGGTDSASSPNTAAFFPAAEEEWRMVWSDEFDGDSLDMSKWDIQEGDGSEFGLERWGNNEQQWYSASNLTVADGHLTITAKSEELVEGFPYTSGRIRTAGNFSFKYGRAEAAIRSAAGQGLWSAFWMLPEDSPYAGWASSGEVDIMEVINAETDGEEVFGSLHHGFAWPLNRVTSTAVEDVDPAGDFHVYAVEWSERYIRWYLDGEHYKTVEADAWYSYYYQDRDNGYTAGAGAAPFDVDFHMLLNLAVGGNLPGVVDDGAIPAEMVVDYVRVYECTYDTPDGTGCNSNADRTLEGPNAQSAFEDQFNIYMDGASALEWSIAGETVSRQLAVASFWNNDGALSFSEVPAAESERGTVIEVVTSNSGNISIYAEDGEPTDIFGMGNNPAWWQLHAGELKFDIKVMSAGTDADSSLMIKMDSGWPALGYYDLKVSSLPADTWASVSVPINELLANSGEQPLDMGSIISFFVLEPTGAAHVQVDNIEIACGHPENNGCGIRPPGGAEDGEVVNVYIDEVDPIWTNGIGAWDTTAGVDYFEGDSNNLVTWAENASGDPERDMILSVNFGTNGANGVWFIQSASGVDLSSFAAEGKLIFDLRLQAGTTHGITYKIDCFFPCTSGDQVLDLSNDVRGEWNTHEIAIADLVASGLDLSKVNTGLVMFPTWGEQQGVSFELDNIRWENEGSGGGDPGPGEPTIAGTWQVAAEAGALKVGPEKNSGAWWQIDDAGVVDRACFFDDQYDFSFDGTFQIELQDETWLEGWQTGSADACGAPVFPHDGMGDYTYTWDEEAGTLTVNGVGAYIGLPKATNSGELGSPSEAPPSITYEVTFEEPTRLTVNIEAGSGVHWTYTLVKVAEPPAPPAVVGTWQVAGEAGALKVGPEKNSGAWWQIDSAGVTERACYFDDQYILAADGSFSNVLQDETWIEGWQSGSADACGAPVFPHDGVGDATWEWDEGAGTLTLNGTGAYLGLPKAVNSGELGSPSEAPSSVTYEVTLEEDGSMTVNIEAGSGVHWTYKLVKN